MQPSFCFSDDKHHYVKDKVGKFKAESESRPKKNDKYPDRAVRHTSDIYSGSLVMLVVAIVENEVDAPTISGLCG